MQDLDVARVFLLFSFTHLREIYQCAVVRCLPYVKDEQDEDTGMWIVERRPAAELEIVPLDSIYRAAHLIPVYHGLKKLPRTLTPENSLDMFRYYYVNKFIDHHAFEILQ
jgi:hypothetical protein